MRQSKMDHESLFQEARMLNTEKWKESLILILNSSTGVEPTTGTPLTPELQKKFTNVVVTLKTTAEALALLGPGSNRESVAEMMQKIRVISDLLTHVRMQSYLRLSGDNRTIVVAEVLYSDPNRRSESLEQNNWCLPGMDIQLIEARALMAVMALVREGSLDSLRRCVCGDWFLAVRSDQRSCSMACRQRKYATNPDFNQKRRERYRNAKKRAAVIAKKAGGRSEG